MKNLFLIPLAGILLATAGCATTAKVQEMIDASHQDYLAKSKEHEASIDVLKRSAMAGLEKSKQNSDELVVLNARMEDVLKRVEAIQSYAEASKVMSSANTVKVADLEATIKASGEVFDEALLRMAEIDKLYESVLMRHYQMMSDSATAAIETLKADGVAARANAPLDLNEPIEIVAPDTSVSNAVSVP